MAVRGRKPKPTAIKVLEGNPGHRPVNDREPKAPPGMPSCPKWLDKRAKAEWKRMSAILKPLGLLTNMDRAAFAGYCQAYGRWQEAEEELSKTGLVFSTPSGYMQQSPYVAISQANLKTVIKFCEQFGLTPTARSRIISGGNAEQEEKDEMESILGGA